LQVKTEIGAGGEVVHRLARPPSALPSVTKRDLEQAWELAQTVDTPAPPARKFSFATVPPVELWVQDKDAAAWVAAVEGCVGLGTPHGVSVCLRLLGLVALMAEARWAQAWFVLGRGGAEIRSELLQAAALAPLNESGGFDETTLRALLPLASTQGAKS
jgi:hypothetical protein